MPSRLVSIVIPTFNRAYCLGNALRGVIAQSHGEWEAIVIDDGSTDDTEAVVAEFAAADSRIRYYRKENGGVSAARNMGLRHSRGDYIAFLDSDDVWKPWKLEVQLAGLQALPEAGMIWTDMEAMDENGNAIFSRYLRTMYGAYDQIRIEKIFSGAMRVAELPILANHACELAQESPCLWFGFIYPSMFHGNLVHTSTVLLTRDRLNKVGGFDETLRVSGEDYDFHLRTCAEGCVAFLDIPTISYRVGASDQLTQPRYHLRIARNYLRTLVSAFERENRSGLISRSLRRQTLGRAYAWIGEELFYASRYSEARDYLSRSLTIFPFQTRTANLLAMTCIPAGILERLRSFRRSLVR